MCEIPKARIHNHNVPDEFNVMLPCSQVLDSEERSYCEVQSDGIMIEQYKEVLSGNHFLSGLIDEEQRQWMQSFLDSMV